MGDYTVVIVGAAGFVVVLIVLMLVGNRRSAQDRVEREEAKEAEQQRVEEREAELAELDQHGRLLYQLIERVDALFEVQQEQARELASIRSSVGIIAVLMVLGVIAGVVLALLG